MIYDKNALKNLVIGIGMKMPVLYLIEGNGSEKIYKSLAGKKKEKGYYYSLVAEAIHDVISSDDFKFRSKPGERVKKNGSISRLQTRKKTYHDIRDDPKREDFTGYEISNFNRIYGLGCIKETHESLSKKINVPINEIKTLSKRIRKILRDGKDINRPGEYRSKIWHKFHEKLRDGNSVDSHSKLS